MSETVFCGKQTSGRLAGILCRPANASFYDEAAPPAARRAKRGTDFLIATQSRVAFFLGRITKSKPVGTSLICVRNDSRIKRFQRFRVTALPVFLGIVIPSRAGFPGLLGTANNTKTASAAHLPRRIANVNSSLRRTRTCLLNRYEHMWIAKT